MDDHANVLVAAEDSETAQAAGRALQEAGHACTAAPGLDAGIEEARSGRYDVVVVALEAAGERGFAVLAAARNGNPDCQVIVITPHGRADEAVAAMRAGALYYLEAPVNPAELTMIVDRAVERVALTRDRALMQSELTRRYGFDNIIGSSRPMQKVFGRVAQVARTNATVLIQGDTGTGKELIARAIHYNSDRRHNRFVPLNCAGLVETILESELFGHEKGAFTGAVSARVGLFEYANHGTLFLDEIGDMPLASQTKLLRVLEHGEIVRVGSNEPIRVDVRLVAATNQNLHQSIADGTFRRDLFYRLNVVTIRLPELRERQGDIPLLVDHYLREFARAYGKSIRTLKPSVRKALYRYAWPGNVRELRNCIEHMVVATTDDILGEDDLPDYMLEQAGASLAEPSLAALAGQPLEEVEKRHIARTLELVDGNREKAAELLGIGERTLYRKIEKYGLR
ncbi:MAG: sigma-54-dependent Fis family transcriptional regulator [Candidatus Brocadiaceae bacterium]|nr:sigma-54-dependent Fis family transcriptional regulator [Candidatus Brocadiaceae bacterium]